MGPTPFILVLTITGEPDTNDILIIPVGGGVDWSSGGGGGDLGRESVCALER